MKFKGNNQQKKFYYYIVIFFIVFLIQFAVYLYFKNKIENVKFEDSKNTVLLVSTTINTVLSEIENSLKLSKITIENEFAKEYSKENIEKSFSKKYKITKNNKISNYKYVISNRKYLNAVSTTYLNRIEKITDDIKRITVLTEKIDTVWNHIFENFSFVTLTYVDKTGFYREFPFRKIEPTGVNNVFYNDPRNLPYFSLAITAEKNKIFVTKPYTVEGDNLYLSFGIPVYEDNNFRGLLTIDIDFNRFDKWLKNNFRKSVDNINIFIIDNHGTVYLYYLTKKNNNYLRTPQELRNAINSQNSVIEKNLKLYSILKDRDLINTVKELLKESDNYEDKTFDFRKRFIIGFHKLSGLELFLLVISENTKNVFISYFDRFFLILIFQLIVIVGILVFVLGKGGGTDITAVENMLKEIINKVNPKELAVQYKGEDPFHSEENFFQSIEKLLAAISQKNKLIMTVINTIDIGLCLVDGSNGAIILANSWFKHFVAEVQSLDLMPEILKEYVENFLSGKKSIFSKNIKIFEKHYDVSLHKIENENNQNIVLICMKDAEKSVVNKSVIKDLEKKISILEKELSSYEKQIEELNTKFIQSDKLAVFGEVIQGIVHNINNPMMIIESRLSLIKTIIEGLENSHDKKRLLKHIEQVIASTSKINKIIESVLIKARITANTGEKIINVNSLIKSELEFFNSDLFYKHKVEKEIVLDNNIPEVRISESDFSQVLHNIIKNAMDALKSVPSPKLTIRTYADEENKKVFVEILDNGPGVKKEHREKIFEQYFTTKGTKGTGIGLYNARKIIEDYGGELKLAESKTGAKFLIILPIAGA